MPPDPALPPRRGLNRPDELPAAETTARMRLQATAPGLGSSVFPGRPLPMGATWDGTGTNFSVLAEGTASVELCLVDAGGSELRLPMEERTFGAWHSYVPGIGPGQRYGYRVPGRDPAKILLDPYARRIDSTLYDLAAASTPGVDSLGKVPLGMVVAPVRSLTARPRTPWEHTVIYEAHIVGATRLHHGIPAELRGTYLGMGHPAMIEHLTGLGVTTLELLPVHAHASEPGLVASGRENYWGYSTLGFFAPHPRFASRRGAELTEFVAMVDALHNAGIEVVLDVVYNHTCEGDLSPSLPLSFRGLAPEVYYLAGRDITGTGNTIDPAPLPVIRLVTDSLRYWATDLGVDGFRFDLASVLGRPRGGSFDSASTLLSAIAQDPVLADRKLIAEPWDATAEGYAMGRFGPLWTEWNDHYRDTVRDYWRSATGVRDLGYRLSGSADLFGAERRPWASINFVTAHDGFTLRDLVSYDHKHNEANGEGGRDGTDNNRSANYGVEGDTDDPAILEMRLRQVRNLAATLLLSTGTPMICGGDEMGRSQAGNNNAYCQDNPVSWTDWSGLMDTDGVAVTGSAEADLVAFFSRTLALRKDSPALHQGEFFQGRPPRTGDGIPDLVWFGTGGQVMTAGDWFDDSRRTLLMWVDGRDVRGHSPDGALMTDDSWLMVLHSAAEPVEITLPGEPYSLAYSRVVDTATSTGEPADDTPLNPGVPISLPGRSFWLLRAHRDPNPA